MCVAALAWHAHPRWLLVAIGNRDELHARPAAPLGRWTDASGIVAGRDRYVWETTVGAQRTGHVHYGVGEDDFMTMRTARDATLSMPKIIMPAVQVNMRAGHLPEPEANGNLI